MWRLEYKKVHSGFVNVSYINRMNRYTDGNTPL